MTSLTSPIHDSVDVLPGVGPKKKKAFADLGVHQVKDLLGLLPKSYQLRHRRLIADLEEGEHAIVVAQVLRLRFIGRARFRRLEVVVKDESGVLKLVFFNPSDMNVNDRFAANATITVLGLVANYAGIKQMAHPRVFSEDKSESLEGLWPAYAELKGIFPSELGKIVKAALEHSTQKPTPDVVPQQILHRYNMRPLIESYNVIHAPPRDVGSEELSMLMDQSHQAFRRIAFEELLTLQLAMQRRRLNMAKHQSHVVAKTCAKTILQDLLPFTPTNAQTRVLEEILSDLARPYPMTRMLQGDVGAGKTAVAAAACMSAAKAGLQCALMVPTEILAEQHYQTLRKLFASSGLNIGYLVGSLSEKERKRELDGLKNHQTHIVIGTHALISDDVFYRNLGLCIIDEQHRFGVNQRAQLKDKGKNTGRIPHLLAMTATPIPRSLALTAYGDFALSVLDELPPGRQPVQTHVLRGDATALIVKLAHKLKESDEQAYVIYPLVEESEKLDLLDATKAFEELNAELGEHQVALIHGRMKAAQKDEAMARFKAGDIRLLVSTTVIEVGVDVPNATCMVVVHAERFGLSQLHQLRGRVGRGHKKSRCYLITDKMKPGDDTYRRLSIMEKTNDGFVIATEDLAIRGPGDFLGTRQSGAPLFNFCDLTKHADLVEPARELAIQMLGERDSP